MPWQPALQPEGQTILMVDDTPANLGVLAHVLEESGLQVLVAQDGEEAIARARRAHPDLILLDVMMPGIDGFETCRRLKSLEETRDIPVIFMTALLEQTAAMGGTAPQLLHDADFLAVLERALRADWEIYDGYRYRPAEPLPVPILAVRGAEDTYVDAADLGVWREQTTGEFRLAQLDSGHWALDAAGTPALAGEIAAALAGVRPARP